MHKKVILYTNKMNITYICNVFEMIDAKSVYATVL